MTHITWKQLFGGVLLILGTIDLFGNNDLTKANPQWFIAAGIFLL